MLQRKLSCSSMSCALLYLMPELNMLYHNRCQRSRSYMPTFVWLVDPSEIHYGVKLHQNLTSSFQLSGNYLSRSNVKVRHHRNLIIYQRHPNAYFLLSYISFWSTVLKLLHGQTAHCGLWGCKNGGHSVSWLSVLNGFPNQGLVCFVSLGKFFCSSFVFRESVVFCFFVSGCQYHCNQLPEKTRVRNDCCVSSGTWVLSLSSLSSCLYVWLLIMLCCL